MSEFFGGLGISDWMTPDRIVSVAWALVTLTVGMLLARHSIHSLHHSYHPLLVFLMKHRLRYNPCSW